MLFRIAGGIKMAEKVDRRVRKTKAQLRAGLARLMQKKSIKEITVKELVEEVDINRSTFYLHYTDIYQMLESIEAELMEEITHLVADYPLDPLNNKESSYPFIEQIFTILDHNKDICIALLGKNGDMAFVNRIEKLIADTVLHRLSIRLPKDNRDIEYAYAFCLNGCVGMIKTWLSSENQESTQHMAELTHKLIDNATLICIRTAFSVVPQNLFILRCCFSHLKKSSTNHLFL